MILSREAVRRIGPHLHTCINEMYSSHEDVEIGRCVRRFAGVNCVTAYQVSVRGSGGGVSGR